jgi:hypothetical protein
MDTCNMDSQVGLGPELVAKLRGYQDVVSSQDATLIHQKNTAEFITMSELDTDTHVIRLGVANAWKFRTAHPKQFDEGVTLRATIRFEVDTKPQEQEVYFFKGSGDHEILLCLACEF